MEDLTQDPCKRPQYRKASAKYRLHGEGIKGSESPEYKAWTNMKTRARRKKGYEDRQVCAEWKHDFGAFLAHVGRKPGPEYSLERIRNDEGYKPGNCKWATVEEQARNKSNSRLVTLLGITRTMGEWGAILNIPVETIFARLNAGRSPSEVLSVTNLRTSARLSVNRANEVSL